MIERESRERKKEREERIGQSRDNRTTAKSQEIRGTM
jgi:hypothetical protein